jgi:hypothetical protein
MPVTFQNNWKNIMDKLESVFETEFKNTLPIYKGYKIPTGINQALQMIPLESNLEDQHTLGETREYVVNLRFIFNEINVNETALDHILRQVERIRALVHDNISMTLSDSTRAFNCRLETEILDADEDSDIYVVLWEWKCLHQQNLS